MRNQSKQYKVNIEIILFLQDLQYHTVIVILFHEDHSLIKDFQLNIARMINYNLIQVSEGLCTYTCIYMYIYNICIYCIRNDPWPEYLLELVYL